MTRAEKTSLVFAIPILLAAPAFAVGADNREPRAAAGRENLYPAAAQRQHSPGNTTYHIDPAGGNDASSGLEPKQAWRTFRRVNRLLLAPGDRVEIIAPGAFQQTLMPTGTGTAEKPVEVRFAPGRYDFHPDLAYREAYQISNTNGDPAGLKAVGILLTGARHFLISGPGASIYYRGKMIEVCIDRSEDITLSGLRFDYHRPTVSEFAVEAVGEGFADLRIHKDSPYSIKDGSITWQGVTLRFMHGMGLVNQFSENLTFDGITIAPDEAGGRTTDAWADCIQVSGCRGKLLVRNCVFSGAHDDAINIHGTHLRIVGRLPGRQLKVRFMHPQTFGFSAFNPGDEVEFVHSDSLATYGPNRVTAASLLNPTELQLTLENPVPDEFRENDVLENVTWTPEVEIRGCRVSRIPTRGFLITTRRPVLVEDNEILGTKMSAILIENDAQGWYESGCVRDMMIRKNRFIRCGEPVVHINPRNSVANNSVHRNVRIMDNEFILRGTTSMRARSTSGLRFTGNTIRGEKESAGTESVQTSDCADLLIEDNIFPTP